MSKTDELVQKYHTDPSTLTPENRVASDQALQYLHQKRAAGEFAMDSVMKRHFFPVGLDDRNGYKPYPVVLTWSESVDHGTHQHRLPTPAITDTMRASAAKTPGAQLYVIDPDSPGYPEEAVPEWAVQGAFAIDADGQISAERYWENPKYRPGPRKSGFRLPTNHLERVVELAATGYGTTDAVVAALIDPGATLITMRKESDSVSARDDGGIHFSLSLFQIKDGGLAMQVYTSPDRVPEAVPTNPAVPIRFLMDILSTDDPQLILNPDSPDMVIIPSKNVVRSYNERTTADASPEAPAAEPALPAQEGPRAPMTESKTDEPQNPQLPPPPITDDMRADAAGSPGSFLYDIDSDFQGDPNGAVPPWAIAGAFPIDSNGQISEETFEPNPNYRPGPRRSGFPKPTNQVERALELAAAGYGPFDAIVTALVAPETELITVTDKKATVGDDGKVKLSLPLFGHKDGGSAILAYTSAERVNPETTTNPGLPVSSLIAMGMFNESDLVINNDSPPMARISGKDIVRAFNEQHASTGSPSAPQPPAPQQPPAQPQPAAQPQPQRAGTNPRLTPASGPQRPQLGAPLITMAMRNVAFQNPGQQLHVIDPEYAHNPDLCIPGWAIRGFFAVGPQGQILPAAFQPNPSYRPGPRTLGFPPATNNVERALELVVTGYGPLVALPAALAAPDALLITVNRPDMPNVVFAYTSPGRVPPGTPVNAPTPVRAFAQMFGGGADLVLNPNGTPSTRVPGAEIIRAFNTPR